MPFLRLSCAVVVLAGGLAAAPPSEAAADPEAAIAVPAPSRRISASPPAPVDPPALPAGADAVPPMTISVVTSWRGGNGQPNQTRQSVLRTAERILVIPEGGREEWLFVRNVVDPRRLAGYLVDHSRRRVLVHDESDLHPRLELRGWADVLMMRFDPRGLGAMTATGERQSAAGASFERYVSTADGPRDVAEVWWSETLLLPLRLTVHSPAGETTSVIEASERSLDAARLSEPRLRWSGYETIDVADEADRASHHH